MASEIRVDKINSLSGVGTVTLSPTGVDIAGITTAATLRATTGIVTSLTAGSLTSLGAVSGTTGTFTSHVSLGDSDELRLGAGNDLKLYHNGNNSFIEDAGTGDFYIRGADNVRIQSYSDNEDMAKFVKDGAVELYHNNSKKFETSSTGVSITGQLDLSSHLDMGDNDVVKLGDGDDLQLYHDGSNSYVKNYVGNLFINANDQEKSIACVPDGTVELYHNNVKKIETTSSGLKVTAANSDSTAFQLYNTDSSANVWYVNGEGNSFQGHIYPRTDSNLDLGYHATNKWRDVVLSGGVRFGSANSADYLDDYEEVV